MKKIAMFLLAAICCFVVSAANVSQFTVKSSGATFRVGNQGGKLARVECFSPVSGGEFNLSRECAVDVYTNAVDILTATSHLYQVAYSNTYTHVEYTNTFNNLSFVDDPYIVGISTNTIVTVTTNYTPVFEKVYSVTNAIVTGGAITNGQYGAAPASTIYLGAGDRLLFSGTAVGGWLRIITE